jgi:hypothetical protein
VGLFQVDSGFCRNEWDIVVSACLVSKRIRRTIKICWRSVKWNDRNIRIRLCLKSGPAFYVVQFLFCYLTTLSINWDHTASVISEWVWSIDGMTLTGEEWSTLRKTCPSAALSTTNPTWTDLGERPATNRPTHGPYFLYLVAQAVCASRRGDSCLLLVRRSGIGTGFVRVLRFSQTGVILSVFCRPGDGQRGK